MTTPTNQPNPPTGYRLLRDDEDRIPQNAVRWNASESQWGSRELPIPVPAFYAVPADPSSESETPTSNTQTQINEDVQLFNLALEKTGSKLGPAGFPLLGLSAVAQIMRELAAVTAERDAARADCAAMREALLELSNQVSSTLWTTEDGDEKLAASADSLREEYSTQLGDAFEKAQTALVPDPGAPILAELAQLREKVEVLTKKQPINTSLRLFDLVRYMRSELHQADLITDSEYGQLCAGPMAISPKGGSPSRLRLEDYDQLRVHNTKLLELAGTAIDFSHTDNCKWQNNGDDKDCNCRSAKFLARFAELQQEETAPHQGPRISDGEYGQDEAFARKENRHEKSIEN